jgi:hypothetical protein
MMDLNVVVALPGRRGLVGKGEGDMSINYDDFTD